MENKLACQYYSHGECPNCFEPIDKDAVEGDNCKSCGFAFMVDDDTLDDDYDDDTYDDDWDHRYLEEDYDD